ncbi:MAG: peptidyl-prolyl cis-trans isomerase [Acidobacteriota bacterium]
MRPIAVGVIVAALFTSASTAAERQLVEGIVVRVNDRILTVADMRRRVVEREAETGAPLPPETYPDLVAEAADDLCLLERAAELKVEVGSDEIADALKQLREQNRAADEATFEKMLRSMGMTLEQLRNRMRDSMLMNRALSREVGNLPITDEELRQRFAREQDNYRIPERVHLDHIVYQVSGQKEAEAQVLARARRLVAAARAGGDFATLTKQEADLGAATAGDLGTLAVPDLRAEVHDAVAALKPGEISDPFTSTAGIHVIRLIERVPPAVKPFAEVAEELRQRELGERYRNRLRSVVDELKKRYAVEVYPARFTAQK